jgi:Spy/CpxP family protein refolding chaperone
MHTIAALVLVISTLAMPTTIAAQAADSFPPAIADTIGERLGEIEVMRIEQVARGIESPHPRVRSLDDQIRELRALIGELPDSASARATADQRLRSALEGRLATVIVESRMASLLHGSSTPHVASFRREEELLRARLQELTPRGTR